jgi:hypothetical protein
MMLLDRQNRKQVAVGTEQELNRLRRIISDLRSDTAEKLQVFQVEIKTYNIQLHILATNIQTDSDRVMELTKIKAFNLWMQNNL